MRQRDYTTQTKTDYVYKNSTQPTYFLKEAVFEKRKPLVRPGVQLSFSVESLMLKSILSINIKLRPVNCSFN